MKSGLNCMKYLKDKEGVHLSHRPWEAGLITEEAITKVIIKYAKFPFPLDLTSELPKHTLINNHAIELIDVNDFIRLSKSIANATIFSHLF